jgi:hypothetical protein
MDPEQNYFGTYGKPHLRNLHEENPAAASESHPRSLELQIVEVSKIVKHW